MWSQIWFSTLFQRLITPPSFVHIYMHLFNILNIFFSVMWWRHWSWPVDWCPRNQQSQAMWWTLDSSQPQVTFLISLFFWIFYIFFFFFFLFKRTKYFVFMLKLGMFCFSASVSAIKYHVYWDEVHSKVTIVVKDHNILKVCIMITLS